MSVYSAQGQRRTGSRHLLCKQPRVKRNKIPCQTSEEAQVHLTSNQQHCDPALSERNRLYSPAKDLITICWHGQWEHTEPPLIWTAKKQHRGTFTLQLLQNHSHCFSCTTSHSDSSEEDLRPHLCLMTAITSSSVNRITQTLWSWMWMRHVLTGPSIQVRIKGADDHFGGNDRFPTT